MAQKSACSIRVSGISAEVLNEFRQLSDDELQERHVFRYIADQRPGGPWRGWWRSLLESTTLTFGINNHFDTTPPLSVQGGELYEGFVTLNTNPLQRYFYFQVERDSRPCLILSTSFYTVPSQDLRPFSRNYPLGFDRFHTVAFHGAFDLELDKTVSIIHRRILLQPHF
jgi:hypothetical protein